VGVRIALDTNILIAAITNPGGAGARIVEAWLGGGIEVVASEATVREADLVLGGGWLARMAGADRVAAILDDLRARTAWVDEPPAIDDLPLKDAGDLRLVEAAAAGGASFIVTTDREFLSHRGYGRVEFVTPEEFLRASPLEAPQDGPG